MATVYILYSEQLDRFYTGSCDKLDFRLEQHLSRNFEKSFTAKANDWGLFFSVTDLDYKQAGLPPLKVRHGLNSQELGLLFFGKEVLGRWL